MVEWARLMSSYLEQTGLALSIGDTGLLERFFFGGEQSLARTIDLNAFLSSQRPSADLLVR